MDKAASEPEQTGALAGLRVLDMSRILAGPWAGQLLGDLGADVIKIERPGTGDDTRGWGPPWVGEPTGSASGSAPGSATGDAAYFLAANRNKRSLTIDFAQPAGQDALRRLAERSDVLIENFKVGQLAGYGLDYPTLAASNPRLVYCSITGFGQTGPYAARPGYDLLIQAMGGLMSITGAHEGGPQKVGVALADVLTGLYATVAIQAALAHRQTSGRGQHIDLALLDVQVAALANQAMNYLVTGDSPRRLGNAHPNIVPYQDFKTADGDVVIAVGNDGQFARLCETLGLGALSRDPRFAGNAVRVANREGLIALLGAELAKRSTAAWVAALEAVNVPCGPVNTIADVFADPQVAARGDRIALPHPDRGDLELVANPIRLSQTPVRYHAPPPRLGEHSRAILIEAGFSDEDVAALARDGVI